MKLKTIETYELKELTQKAKQKAYNEWLETIDYCYHQENMNSLENFLNNFDLEVKNYSIDLYSRNFIKTNLENLDENILLLSGNRLLKYVNNNVKTKGKYLKCIDKDLSKYKKINKEIKTYESGISSFIYSKIEKEYESTGFYMCYIFEEKIKNLKEVIRDCNTYTFEDFIEDCVESFLERYLQDLEYNQSFEYFEEEAQNNDYIFDKEGNKL